MPERGVIYPDLDIVLAQHEETMGRTGSSPTPLRSPHLLESALARPQQAAHYHGIDFLTQAVMLMVGISKAHAFLDGNKRTALSVALTFLIANGLEFTGDPDLLAVLLEEATEAPDQENAIGRMVEWISPYVMEIQDISPEDANRDLPEADEAGR